MLFAQRVGDGPRATLFLHGFLGAGRNMSTLARRLVAADPTRSVQLLDLPGHGRSRPLTHDDDFQTVCADVLDTGRALAGERFSIVGHSLGGRVGLAALGAAPELIERLTLLDIGPGPTHELPSGAVATILIEAPERAASREAMGAALSARGLAPGLVEWLLTNLEREGDDFRWKVDRQALLDFHLRTSPSDLWPIAERFSDRIRAVRGAASAYLSPADELRLRALGVPVEVVAGAGHFLHSDAPEAVARAIG